MNSILNPYLKLLVVTVVLLHQHVAFARFMTSPDVQVEPDSEEGVQISPECAVVLVTGGLITGGAATVATSVLFSWFLGVIGFTAEGIAGGSYAALWQSTMPLVKAGSLFAKLQSIAMSGVATTIMPGSIVGGAAAASKIRDVCKVIDDIDPNSNMGKAISVLQDAARQVESKGGDSMWKYAKRGYDAASDGLAHIKDASWHFLHEMMPDNEAVVAPRALE